MGLQLLAKKIFVLSPPIIIYKSLRRFGKIDLWVSLLPKNQE